MALRGMGEKRVDAIRMSNVSQKRKLPFAIFQTRTSSIEHTPHPSTHDMELPSSSLLVYVNHPCPATPLVSKPVMDPSRVQKFMYEDFLEKNNAISKPKFPENDNVTLGPTRTVTFRGQDTTQPPNIRGSSPNEVSIQIVPQNSNDPPIVLDMVPRGAVSIVISSSLFLTKVVYEVKNKKNIFKRIVKVDLAPLGTSSSAKMQGIVRGQPDVDGHPDVVYYIMKKEIDRLEETFKAFFYWEGIEVRATSEKEVDTTVYLGVNEINFLIRRLDSDATYFCFMKNFFYDYPCLNELKWKDIERMGPKYTVHDDIRKAIELYDSIQSILEKKKHYWIGWLPGGARQSDRSVRYLVDQGYVVLETECRWTLYDYWNQEKCLAFYLSKVIENHKLPDLDGIFPLEVETNIRRCPEQLTAVQNFVSEPLTLVDGAAGSGKTATLANIIIGDIFKPRRKDQMPLPPPAASALYDERSMGSVMSNSMGGGSRDEDLSPTPMDFSEESNMPIVYDDLPPLLLPVKRERSIDSPPPLVEEEEELVPAAKKQKVGPKYMKFMVISFQGKNVSGIQNIIRNSGLDLTSERVTFLTAHKAFYSPRKAIQDVNVLVVDECSMMYVDLFTSALSAIYNASKESLRKIIFMGDSGQLPSIRAGNFFVDMCAAYPQYHIKFCHNHRVNADTGKPLWLLGRTVKTWCDAYTKSKCPDPKNTPPFKYDGKTCHFFSGPHVTVDTVVDIMKNYDLNIYNTHIITRTNDDVDKINALFMAPENYNRFIACGAGVDLRRCMKLPSNMIPMEAEDDYHPSRMPSGISMLTKCVGAKVIYKQNNYEHQIWTNEVYYIVGIHLCCTVFHGRGERFKVYIPVRCADEQKPSKATMVDIIYHLLDQAGTVRRVEQAGTMLRTIKPGICSTIYASQGSEYKNAIYFIKNVQTFETNQALYTAITRAKDTMFIVSPDNEAVEKIAANPEPRRNSFKFQNLVTPPVHGLRKVIHSTWKPAETDVVTQTTGCARTFSLEEMRIIMERILVSGDDEALMVKLMGVCSLWRKAIVTSRCRPIRMWEQRIRKACMKKGEPKPDIRFDLWLSNPCRVWFVEKDVALPDNSKATKSIVYERALAEKNAKRCMKLLNMVDITKHATSGILPIELIDKEVSAKFQIIGRAIYLLEIVPIGCIRRLLIPSYPMKPMLLS